MIKEKIMKLSIALAIILVSVASASAAEIHIQYPDKSNINTIDTYRYSGDPVQFTSMSVNSGQLTYSPRVTLRPSHSFDCVNIPPRLDGTKLEVVFADLTAYSSQTTDIIINNFKIQPLTINVWDRGAIRCPHVDFTYNGKEYNGKNGETIII